MLKDRQHRKVVLRAPSGAKEGYLVTGATGATLAASASIAPPFEVASEALTEQRSARSQLEKESFGAEGFNLPKGSLLGQDRRPQE